MANGRRSPRLGFWLLLGFIVLTGMGQAVPLYTDWLWYSEVGFTQVFTTVLSLRGWLFLGTGGVVFLFMYGNLWVAFLGAGGCLSVFFKNGPFSWNGIVGWWIPTVVFGPGSNARAGTPGQNNTGTHGCVNVPASVAAWLYTWAPIGTVLQVVP